MYNPRLIVDDDGVEWVTNQNNCHFLLNHCDPNDWVSLQNIFFRNANHALSAMMIQWQILKQTLKESAARFVMFKGIH